MMGGCVGGWVGCKRQGLIRLWLHGNKLAQPRCRTPCTLASAGEGAAKKWVWLPQATLNTQPAFLGLNCGPERSTYGRRVWRAGS